MNKIDTRRSQVTIKLRNGEIIYSNTLFFSDAQRLQKDLKEGINEWYSDYRRSFLEIGTDGSGSNISFSPEDVLYISLKVFPEDMEGQSNG